MHKNTDSHLKTRTVTIIDEDTGIHVFWEVFGLLCSPLGSMNEFLSCRFPYNIFLHHTMILRSRSLPPLLLPIRVIVFVIALVAVITVTLAVTAVFVSPLPPNLCRRLLLPSLMPSPSSLPSPPSSFLSLLH